jgi:molecular chaperone GrpE (heat shock protein)
MNKNQKNDGTIEATPQIENHSSRNEALMKLLNIEQLLNEDLQTLKESLEIKEKTINRLQEVNHQHERRFYSLVDKDTLKDLCLFKDKMNKATLGFTDAIASISNHLQDLNEEFDDLLYGLGLTPIEATNEFYNRDIQIVKEQIPTKDESLHHTVANVLKAGYRTETNILKKQEVSIYVYQKPVDNE